jgi:ankyrin repeat protein
VAATLVYTKSTPNRHQIDTKSTPPPSFCQPSVFFNPHQHQEGGNASRTAVGTAMEGGDGPLAADLLQVKGLFANYHLSDVLFVFPTDGGAADARRADDSVGDDVGDDDVVSAAKAESEQHLLPAHRLVLALRSGAFHEALRRARSSHVPSHVRFPLKIYIQDTSYRVFATLLRFLYTNQVTESPDGQQTLQDKTEDERVDFWKQLLRAAFIYAVPMLVDICADHLVTLLQLTGIDNDPSVKRSEAQDIELPQTEGGTDGETHTSTSRLRQVFGLLVFTDKMLALHPPSARRRTSNKRVPNDEEGEKAVAVSTDNELPAASNQPEEAQGGSDEVRGLSQSMQSVEYLQRLCVLRLKTVSDRQFEVLLHTDTGKQCSTERICELLKQRSDTPLVVAIRYQLGRVVNELLRLGEPLESVNEDESDLPLVAALKTGNDAIIRRLLVDENAPFFYLTDKIPLFLLACSSGNVLQCEILIDRANADVNLISELQDADKDIVAEFGRQQTPLHIACRKGHSAVVELLLKHKAASNLPDADGNTPLHCAANLETVEVLLSDSFKTNANIPNRRGRTPLHVAAATGDVNVVDYLLRHGAQQDILDDQGQNAFHHAAANGHTAVALVLLHDSESFNPQSLSRKAHGRTSGVAPTALDGNSADGTTDIEEDGTEGFDINMADLKGNTALHLAAMSPSDRCQKMLQLLLENGADPNCVNWFGYTPLHLFCSHQSGPASVVDVFVSAWLFARCDSTMLTILACCSRCH